ncbi:type II toxin-antitoxin system RelE/ParE family toxin [Bacillus sp. DTU_2020_1000418_1_SI_GHA_SEK_038]|uniref:type II toxin-antitoxin system RelE/ParE family toxin n=1 Tax=Bacillus sp. DTU_2020_1000418_1_SI_GHA_SEK_038 TaxID=3077585 RepID=UPI0028E39862|nr:type II toxin-antitoxin system RelE/ParE family toxin [Bacillus sp. DTU_2020_1000418_1_SI_GHA_SEK_038]WNS76396.1 type II toxin-antitoxin system RelE/ParE family toxin [Bacillus sp. DTU_2020_1000418_1_SI_GHA_SEK_038]
MKEEAKQTYQVVFTDEFDLCLDIIQEFYADQGDETLAWWYLKEEEIIDYIESLLSTNPFIGRSVDKGKFKGLRRITYGKSKHLMLNYLIYYAVHQNDFFIEVINILPSRTKRKRVTK